VSQERSAARPSPRAARQTRRPSASRPRPAQLHGGSLAIGHPFGATGARMVTTVANELPAHGKATALARHLRRGLASARARCSNESELLLVGEATGFRVRYGVPGHPLSSRGANARACRKWHYSCQDRHRSSARSGTRLPFARVLANLPDVARGVLCRRARNQRRTGADMKKSSGSTCEAGITGSAPVWRGRMRGRRRRRRRDD
jgi:hypothetical protein